MSGRSRRSDGPRFGIIGTGEMAGTMMATLRGAGVDVRAVASRDESRARRFAARHAIPESCGDRDGVLDREDIEAVYIANAAVDHAEAAIAALAAGKAVLCEKPLALDATSGRRVAKAAERSGRLCMEALWTPFLPAQRRFVELAASGACGTPTHLQAEFGSPERNARPRLLSPAAGGVLLDRGGYLIALALKTLGPVETVTSRVSRSLDGVDAHASVRLDHVGGSHSQLAASFVTMLSNAASLSGPEGRIGLEEPLIGAEEVSIRRARIPVRSAAELADAGAPGTARRPLAERMRRVPLLRRLRRALPTATREHLPWGGDPYRPQLDHFLTLLAAGARESDIVPLGLSLDILAIIDRARSGDQPPACAKARPS